MPNSTEAISEQLVCAVEVKPELVDAAGELTLAYVVTASPPRDFSGRLLLVRDENGETIGSAEAGEFDGEGNQASEISLIAPAKVGHYTWTAVLLPEEGEDGEGAAGAEIATPFSFTVKPHSTSVVVWGVPSAIVAGEAFTINVGIKCSAECRLAGQNFAVLDHDGRPAAVGTLSEPWTGTAALYAGEAALVAPETEGLFQWTATVEACDLDVSEARDERTLPHAAGSATFGVRVVAQPQHVVTVSATDGDSRGPLAGARVVMHPYRAMTNEEGVAVLRVAKGLYKIFVTQARYVTVSIPVEVNADLTTSAELYLEPVVERD